MKIRNFVYNDVNLLSPADIENNNIPPGLNFYVGTELPEVDIKKIKDSLITLMNSVGNNTRVIQVFLETPASNLVIKKHTLNKISSLGIIPLETYSDKRARGLIRLLLCANVFIKIQDVRFSFYEFSRLLTMLDIRNQYENALEVDSSTESALTSKFQGLMYRIRSDRYLYNSLNFINSLNHIEIQGKDEATIKFMSPVENALDLMCETYKLKASTW